MIRIGEAGELARVVDARPQNVGEAGGSVDNAPGAVERPQAKTQVGVVGDEDAVGARHAHGAEDGIGSAGRDRLADAGGVQHLRILDEIRRHIVGRHAARGGAGAHVGEDVAFRTVGDEVEAGMGDRTALDAGGVDALVLPQLHEGFAELVGSDGGNVADAGALARGRDGAIRGVAAMAGNEDVLARRLTELVKRFADGNDVGHALSSLIAEGRYHRLPEIALP